ncbi:hypothetical protein ROTAS13_04274 [Roseomonas sp. TAS13]|nr:hypothetical protein ROTAS13_04274 [Roseomonas sp. TAS13]
MARRPPPGPAAQDSSRAAWTATCPLSTISPTTAKISGAIRCRCRLQAVRAWRRKRRRSASGSPRHSAWTCGRTASITACQGWPAAWARAASRRSQRDRPSTVRGRGGLFRHQAVSTGMAGGAATCGKGSQPWRETTCTGPRCPCARRASRWSTMVRPLPSSSTASSGGRSCSPDRPWRAPSTGFAGAFPRASTQTRARQPAVPASMRHSPSASRRIAETARGTWRISAPGPRRASSSSESM